MSFEGQPNKKEGPVDPSRRKFLKILGGGALAAGGAAATGGLMNVAGDALDEYNAQAMKKAKEYNEFTHIGEARILNKIVKKPGEDSGNADMLSGAYSGYLLGKVSGIPGAGPMFAITNAVNAMNESEDYYIVIEVPGKKPFAVKSFSGEYDSLTIGEMVPVKYHLNKNDRDIVEWAQLHPPATALEGITPETNE